MKLPAMMRRRTPKFFQRGSQWLPTLLVLAVVLLAGARLIGLSVQQRAGEMRDRAQTRVTQYGRTIEAQLQTLAKQSVQNGAPQELDQLLSRLPLSRVIGAEYDFALSKIDVSGVAPRVFVSTRIGRIEDGVESVIRIPEGLSQDLPSGYLELAIRPKTGWYPVRDLAFAVGLLASVAWLLAFATHDLVHSLHRAQDALAHARRQVQTANRNLVSQMEQREQLEQNRERSRYHDPFTGLPNRRYFMDQVDRALRDLRARRRLRVAVLLISIERVESSNDTFGHTAGDELVVQTARRLQQATAPFEGALAYLGGDQFAVLVLDVASVNAALSIASMLQQALQHPIELRRRHLSITARVGLTCTDAGLQRAAEVVREADAALALARGHETADPITYHLSMGGGFGALVSLEADLHVAIQRRELHLQLQPIIDLHTQRAIGAEALLRWCHPVEGTLTPDKFLGLAEEAGLTMPITRWTLRRVCQLAAEWRRRLPAETDFYISLNLAAAALCDRELSAYVAATLNECGIPAHLLKLELTEGGLIHDPVAAREALDALHRLGVEIMLDDFGAGYSSLGYLQLFPFDYVKIDRRFPAAAAMVQMAAGLGLKSIAELVETQATAQDLERMGCDYAQGYYYCEPLEAEEALHMLLAYNPGTPRERAVRSASRGDEPTVAIGRTALRSSKMSHSQ